MKRARVIAALVLLGFLVLLPGLVAVHRCASQGPARPPTSPPRDAPEGVTAPLPTGGTVASAPQDGAHRRALDAPPSVEDDEWSRFPHTETDLVQRFVDFPQYADPTQVFRSRVFNPRDTFLPVAVRLEVEHAFAAATPALQALLHDLETIRDHEFDLAHGRGQTLEIDVRRGDDRSQLRRLGRDPVLLLREGRVFGAARAALPATSLQEQRIRQAGALLCLELGRILHAAGTLTAAESSALQESVCRRRDRRIPR